ncbi:MAG: adenosine kinase [Pseudomonadota bacterium]
MTETTFDVLCIGNAIVDILARTEDDFLVAEGLAKGSMNLIDTERAETLYAAMGPAIEASGGSAGNTAAGIASFGGRAAYVGKVAEDALGGIYRHDMTAQGVHFDTAPLVGGVPTARSMILITPDGERTMNTYLGACVELGPEDIDESVVAKSAITYFEGYLWDPPRAKDALRRAAEIAHANNRRMAITLSDSFCVDRWRDEFLELITSKTVDMVFANETEVHALYGTADTDTALDALRRDAGIGVVTLGEKGSVVVEGEATSRVDASAVDEVADLTGAGDLFAAGFLFGYATGKPVETCQRLGAIAAAEVISHVGPRPQKVLKDLLAG